MPRSPVFNRDRVLAAYDTEGNKCKYCPRHLKPPGNDYRSFMTHLLGCKSFLESSTALGLESSVPAISKAIKEEVSNAHNYYAHYVGHIMCMDMTGTQWTEYWVEAGTKTALLGDGCL